MSSKNKLLDWKVFVLAVGLMTTWQNGNVADAATYTASLSTTGGVSLDVSADGEGANIGVDEVVVTSTCPAGYTLMIAGPDDATLYKNGDSTSAKKISASSGTLAEPQSILDANLNTWGYNTISSDIHNNFIGISSTLTELASSTAASASTGDKISVYYGASVAPELDPGLYKMANDAVINYYLVTSLECTSYQVAFDPNTGASGYGNANSAKTLSAEDSVSSDSSATSTSHTVPDAAPRTRIGVTKMSNQRIAEGVATTLDANIFTAPAGMKFAGWNTKPDGSGVDYPDRAEVTDLAGVGQVVTLYAKWVPDREVLQKLEAELDAFYSASDYQEEATSDDQSINTPNSQSADASDNQSAATTSTPDDDWTISDEWGL